MQYLFQFKSNQQFWSIPISIQMVNFTFMAKF